ncbi:putative ABC transport system ATP-binding protein [Amycolatopsis arida]|uniref:Putative ABC transport system ATP-binding protein n=1 Tax=Amycolatopsis arida TaxID=587909 RepID=A0A1I5ZFZ4_9PSEU|nr:ATP-binding cassette domain-containing protein [Amycolatopsis arida]TDX89642.1 putative ABC transport system ATP-binding protein [Amycolatopsis arida]SFQ55362.1 putative ABC transport system ATP-binding protein [Amycolatopsis arida]
MTEPTTGPESDPPAPVFELRGVGVDYRTPAGPVTAVHDVTLDVPARGVTVLAGPSGSGKSTLLRVLGLFDRPSRGGLRHAGTDVGTLRPAARRALRRRRLSQVFQNPTDNLLDFLSVGDNLRAAARSADRDCPAAEVSGILERLDLAGTEEWKVGALSGGQQQRLGFGCALARGSAVVLADEPTSQLDEASADRVLAAVRLLVEREVAVVLATHDPRLVALGSRVARLRAGSLLEVTGHG